MCKKPKFHFFHFFVCEKAFSSIPLVRDPIKLKPPNEFSSVKRALNINIQNDGSFSI